MDDNVKLLSIMNVQNNLLILLEMEVNILATGLERVRETLRVLRKDNEAVMETASEGSKQFK